MTIFRRKRLAGMTYANSEAAVDWLLADFGRRRIVCASEWERQYIIDLLIQRLGRLVRDSVINSGDGGMRGQQIRHVWVDEVDDSSPPGGG